MPKNKNINGSSRAIRVRMYRVGFGDCFLLSIPIGTDDYRHFVIDCGVHGQGNIRMINKAVEEIGKVTGNKIAAVIATHSHQDHISGFSEEFTKFEIGEVWLPWSEDPTDELANQWRKKQASLAASLESHFAAQALRGSLHATSDVRKKSLAALVNVTSNVDTMKLLNAAGGKKGDANLEDFGKLTSNAKAMKLLNSGFNVGAKVSYLEAGTVLKDVAGVPGLEVRVLGPPRDKAFLGKMDPPADQEFLRMNVAGEVESANKLRPFPQKWMVNYDDPATPRPLPEEEEKQLQDDLLDEALDALAFTLDHAKNNTSLVTLFVYRGKYLLFPGDAQYGNWKYWLDQKDADEILSQVNFLKVAHHGSHNATPKGALDKMTADDFAAMVSTQSTPWDVIPRVPLMSSLDTRTHQRVVRSDWIDIPGAPGPLADSAPVRPAQEPSGFTKTEFWYDYEIPLS